MTIKIYNKEKTRLDWQFDYREHAGIKFKYDVNNRLINKRMNTYFTKEPKTIEWIDSFEPHDTLVDIGANIGLYTLYAAKRGAVVHAFEPHAGNFAELVTNIYINEFDKVKAYPFAIMDKISVNELAMLSIVPAQSHNDFGMNDDRVKHYVAGFTLDYTKVKPHHIKIDVDGIEHLMLKGGESTVLKSNNVKSIILEINEDFKYQKNAVSEILKNNNFIYQEKNKIGVKSNCYNYIFKKKNL